VEDGTGPLHARLYVQVDPTGHAGDGFRIPLYGGNLEVDIWGQDIFEDPDFHAYRFRYEIDPARIDIRPNALTSKWEDWEELLARGNLIAFEGANNDDVTTDVRKLLHAKISSNPDFGAALRWGIQAIDDKQLKCVLQALPRPAGFLRRDARLNTDFCGAIELSSHKIVIPFQTDRPCRGPIPILFSRDVEKTKEELTTHPEHLHPGKI
jgi:hypothetical protein